VTRTFLTVLFSLFFLGGIAVGICWSQATATPAKQPSPSSTQQTAQTQPAQQKQQVGEQKKFDAGAFTYSGKERRDPFEPIFLLRVKKSRESISGRLAGKSSGARKGYELEELKLVGIIMKEKNRYAMMEDSEGRGVLFKKGDPVNPNLTVLDVETMKVVFGYRIKGEVKKFELEIKRK